MIIMDVMVLRAKMVREWNKWIWRVIDVIRELVPDAKVYLIGSVARGEAIGSSDVDLLVVSEHAPESPREQARLKTLIEERAGLPLYHPLEIHFTKPLSASLYLRRSGKYLRLI